MLKIERAYKDEFKRSLVMAIIQIVIGVLLFFLPIENAIDVFMIIFGVYLIIISIPRLIFFANDKTQMGRYTFYAALLYLIVGILLLFFSGIVISIIVAILLIAGPIARLIVSDNKKQVLKEELFTIAVGIFVLVFGIGSAVKVIRIVAGVIVILFAIMNLYIAYTDYRKARKEDNVLDAKIKEIE